MISLSNSGRLVAIDLRPAERSINLATRDAAQLLLTTLDVAETEKLSPAIAYRTVKATVDPLRDRLGFRRSMQPLDVAMHV